jgi:hypothetical protein
LPNHLAIFDFRFSIADLPIVDFRLPIADLPIADFRLPIPFFKSSIENRQSTMPYGRSQPG